MGLREGRSSRDFLDIRPFSMLHRDIVSWRLSLLLFALVALFSYTPNALAVEGLPFSMEAFGTLGLAKSNSDDAYFRNSYIQAKGVDDSWSHNIDSNLGIQVSLEPSEKFSATIQSLLDRQEGFQRDLAAIQGQVKNVETEAEVLCELFPDASAHVQSKEFII